MIYEYKDLKGVIKVGDTVRAVPGKKNSCNELKHDGSNEQKITRVDDYGFCINGCFHGYSEGWYLDLNPTPSWDNLHVGDVIVNKVGDKAMVLEVGASGKTFLKSSFGDYETAHTWYHINEAQESGWTLEGAIKEVEEVTMQQVCEKFGHEVKIKLEQLHRRAQILGLPMNSDKE